MDSATDISAQVASTVPVPSLQRSFATFKLMHARAETNRRQMQVLMHAAAALLLALNAHIQGQEMHNDRDGLEIVLERVANWSEKLVRRGLVTAFLDYREDENLVESTLTGLNCAVDPFQIGEKVSMQQYTEAAKSARLEDQTAMNAALKELLKKDDAHPELLGESDVVIHPFYNDLGRRTDGPLREKALVSLLEGIREALTHSEATAVRDSVLEDVVTHLRTLSTKPPPPTLAANPIPVLLKRGLNPDVLIGPLKWKMRKYMWLELLTLHLDSAQCARFQAGETGSRDFIDHLMVCDDRALQYAALEVFMQDKEINHFFKLDFEYTPSDDLNPILANLKPGLAPAVLVPPLRYGIHKWSWKSSLTQHLDSAQIATFFGSGPDGCQAFIDYLVGSDNVVIQYAALDVFREDKQVAHYFIPEEVRRRGPR